MAEHPAYPVGLRLTGRRVVVLGGGQVAQRRLPALVAAGADVTLVSPSATPSVEAMADTGEIAWERRRYADGDLDGAWY
ncbi:bifunctional precorrin-2 dehydrogenase/sirohydrochlorin ferrochelatase, partial [Streptomyces sp. UH6]|uniref:precorrin-2 dehydrogenase/sirohydrochlorin ferrochelatase family protein n=2 Tax=Streptomyces TaxID=1883 RepID=UPI0017EF2C2D